MGTFRISHYCPCSICNGGYSGTATGATLTPWCTIAVDQSVIKLNSTVYIDGYGEFKAQDTGSAIKGNRIDVCVSSHEEAYRLGVV
ncbi:MAG: 3D domain-containing protein [Evtepia sp.]|uniref:3D domain-containing protein n=1 Tax=Evtepia sp. TaxID=2773933 RepID=UPI002A74C8F8|nr:3D domain-containing protein [Evtepia sp.]MDY3014970.1 3D domain-containing protein [Evtepia sp.]